MLQKRNSLKSNLRSLVRLDVVRRLATVTFIIPGLVVSSSAVVEAQQPSQKTESVLQFALDPAKTTIHFTLGATGHTVHGDFTLARGRLSFDPRTGRLDGEIVLDARSGKTGNDSRDAKMHKDVLNSDTFPEISFRPDRAEGFSAAAGKLQGTVHGSFSIHGAAHEISVPVAAEFSSDRWSATANFSVPYVEWGLKNPSNFLLRVSKTVDVIVELSGQFTRANQ